ncbi:MAG: hypothetical protein FLDDKLPJ_02654 [Phycisphaerae bacterium]|nr:hypothetical protein [Phycisphaerae bacterium]
MFSWAEENSARNEFLSYPAQIRDSIEIELARISENPNRYSRTAPSPPFLPGYRLTWFQYHDGEMWNAIELLFSVDETRKQLRVCKLASP